MHGAEGAEVSCGGPMPFVTPPLSNRLKTPLARAAAGLLHKRFRVSDCNVCPEHVATYNAVPACPTPLCRLLTLPCAPGDSSRRPSADRQLHLLGQTRQHHTGSNCGALPH